MIYSSKGPTTEEKKEIAAVFANKVFLNPLLAEVWPMQPGNYKNAFKYAYKINYEKVKAKHPARSNLITPPGGFRLPRFTIHLLKIKLS